MPARHDLLVGALDFPWKPWGSIEIWEDAVTRLLRRAAGVSTMLVSDHPHLSEAGGENYHHGVRRMGLRARPRGRPVAQPTRPVVDRDPGDADYPGPRTMTSAARWLDQELSAKRRPEERALLVVDEFDPREPFDVPEPWAGRYHAEWDGPRMIWPPYARNQTESGLTEREGRHLRSQYGAKLTMIDDWLGRILEVIDRHDAWDTTAFVLCTDHGHYLGERSTWGKPAVPVYLELGHIPLLVSWPGVVPGTSDALTTTVDLHATICDAFGVTAEHRTHGRSVVPLLDGTATSIRDRALCGIWGREIHVLDATRTFAQAPIDSNRPLSMFSNRWSTMPLRGLPDLRMPRPDHRAVLETAPGSDVRVIRQPFDPSDAVPFWATGSFAGDLLFDHQEATAVAANGAAGASGALENRSDRPAEVVGMTDLLVEALRSIEAPAEQLARLGLS